MMIVRCYLAPSGIEGLGVFAHDDIEAGDKVWRYDRMLDIAIPYEKFDQVDLHVQDFLDRYAHPDLNRPGYLILKGDEARFINHAQRPNLDFSGGIWGIVLTGIAAGTELTCNYADFLTGRIVMHPPRHRVAQALPTAH